MVRFLKKPFALPSPKAYPAIEGLRGILALVVCLGHFGMGTLLSPWGLAFNLHFAVDLFFIISGLVLAYSNYYASQPVTAFDFIVKRLARLYPLHALTLIIICALNILRDLPSPPFAILKNVFLIHNIGIGTPTNALNFPSWSISVEFWATLLLFFVTQTLRSRQLLSIVAIGYLLLFSTLCSAQFMAGGYEAAFAGILNVGLLRGFAGTFVGILLYFALDSAQYRKFFSFALVKYSCLIGLAIFFICELPTPSVGAFYVFSFCFIGALCQGDFLRCLSSRLLIWLGTLSYSIYLLHIPVYYTLQTWLGNGAVKDYMGKLVLLPLLFSLSLLSFFFFEQPMQQQFKKRFLQWRFSATQPGLAEIR